MNNEQDLKMTAFDGMIQNREMQMLKAAIPYFNQGQQRMMSVYVKYWELQRTMDIYDNPENNVQICSVPEDSDAPLQMLNDIKEFCNEREKESIDMIINFMEMFSTYESLFS